MEGNYESLKMSLQKFQMKVTATENEGQLVNDISKGKSERFLQQIVIVDLLVKHVLIHFSLIPFGRMCAEYDEVICIGNLWQCQG